MKVRNFIIWSKDSEGSTQEDWIQALDAKQAVQFLGIPESDVITVAVEMPHWKKSNRKGCH